MLSLYKLNVAVSVTVRETRIDVAKVSRVENTVIDFVVRQLRTKSSRGNSLRFTRGRSGRGGRGRGCGRGS